MPTSDQKDTLLATEATAITASNEALPAQPELSVEEGAEQAPRQDVIPHATEEPKVSLTQVAGSPTMQLPDTAPGEALQKEVENILAEDLEDAYKELPEAQRKEFKRVGEQTASTISQLLTHAKVQVSKIIKLLMSWLRMIPKVNGYFLEQEAKIKVDKLLKMRENLHPEFAEGAQSGAAADADTNKV